jgi:NAD(P)H-nitrite reductase large subunit
MSCCDKSKKEKVNIEFNKEGLICYCFKHSKQELFDAIQSGNEKDILDDIKSKMKDPGCFCETANPSGKCCLADNMAYIKHFKSNL